MRVGRWAAMNLPVGEAFAEISSAILTDDQRRRLALAWMNVYLSSGAGSSDELTWMMALGYYGPDWDAVRDRFARILDRGEGRWGLAFLERELARQETVSKAQQEKSLKRWGPGEAPEMRDHETRALRGAGVHAVAPHRNGVHPAASPSIPAGSRTGDAVESPASASASASETLNLTPPPPASGRRRENAEWVETFEKHFWPTYREHRNTGKAAALAVWQRIEPKTQATFDAIWSGLQACLPEWKGKEQQYIPHARTWLFQRRWLDHAEVT